MTTLETHDCAVCQKTQTMGVTSWHWLDVSKREPAPVCLECARIIRNLQELDLGPDGLDSLWNDREGLRKVLEDLDE